MMEEFTDLVISDDAIVWCFNFCVGLLILLMIIHLVVRSPYDILFPEKMSAMTGRKCIPLEFGRRRLRPGHRVVYDEKLRR